MTVFDGQMHARRSCSYFTQRQLGDMLKFRDDPIVSQPASAVAGAGGHRALVALLQATAPDRPDRERRRLRSHWVPLRGYAAATLTLLARVDEVRPQLVAAGAVPVLIDMLDETQPFAFAEVPFSVTALLGVLPVDLNSSTLDGPWVKPNGQPLTLGEVAATALAALTGRAQLYRVPYSLGSGAGTGWAEQPLAEYFITQVAQRLSSFGTSGARELLESPLPLTEEQAAFVAETRDTNVGVIDMLTQDYKTAKAIVKAGAVVPLVQLAREQDSHAARCCLRAVSVSPDVEMLIRDAGGDIVQMTEEIRLVNSSGGLVAGGTPKLVLVDDGDAEAEERQQQRQQQDAGAEAEDGEQQEGEGHDGGGDAGGGARGGGTPRRGGGRPAR